MPHEPQQVEERPAPRDTPISFRVDDKLGAAAKQKALREHRRLSAILRAFLLAWVKGEVPSPPGLPGEGVRAKKRKRKGAK